MGVARLSSRADLTDDRSRSVPPVPFPGSGLEPGMNGGALAFSLERGAGLVPLEVTTETGVVGGLRGRLGEAPP